MPSIRYRVPALTVVTLAIALVAPLPAAAVVDLELRYWFPTVDGSIAVEGTDFDLGLDFVDLGLEADDSVEGRVTLRPGLGFYIRGAYTNLSTNGASSTQVDLPGDLIPPINVGQESKLDFDYARLALGWGPPLPGSLVSFALFVEAAGVRGDVSATATGLGLTETVSESFEGGFVAVGGWVQVEVGKLQVFGEAAFGVNYDVFQDADTSDWELGVRYKVAPILGLGAGWRSLKISGDIDGIRPDITWDGAFVTAVLDF